MTLMDIVLLVVAIVLVPLAIAGASLAPWVPTRRKDLSRIAAHLDLKHGDVFYEIGSGDGRVSRYIAKQFPEATVIGIEMATPLYLLSLLHLLIQPAPNLKIKYGNALKMDLSDASAIFTFATIGTINKKLKPKLLRECKKGCRIISYEFRIRDWPGKERVDEPEGRGARLYVYEK